jgi:LCP family protein required for cell wall assembly
MRFPQWFVLVWVIGGLILAAAGAVGSYMFVRAQAADLDEVAELPRWWDDDPSEATPSGVDAVARLPTLPSPPPEGGVVTFDWPAPPPLEVSGVPDADPPVDDVPGDDPPADDSSGDDGASDAASAGAVDDGDDADIDLDALDLDVLADPRRKTVLLLGIDQRAGEKGPFPTDTIILLSVHPAENTAALLSIPRDLWVNFPGLTEPGRINQANILGDEYDFPGGGGPALAMKTVERMLGLNTIDYYAVINFEVFTTVIDAVGPIEVCPPEPIDDDRYPDGNYGYITIHFDAGCQALGAERLLQYARTRHGDSDIDRAQRQQEVIMATREQVLSLGGVTALLPDGWDVWRAINDNIRTNMSFEEIVSLARIAEGVPSGNIRRAQISFAEVEIGQSPNGDEILIPIQTDIMLLMSDLFRPPGTPSVRGE